ncbi:MAG: lytic transglycosylase domain-containing protein [Magnetococcales bacterium]|nr:lytic transglycosylase domain-containing protein [Magnetococcales bacterium]
MRYHRIKGLAAWACGLLLLWAHAAAADIYTFTDSNGVIHLTDRPLNSAYRLLISSGGRQIKKWEGFPEKSSRRYASSRVITYDGRAKTLPRTVSLGQNTYPRYLTPNRDAFSDTIQDASMRFQIHSALIKAVIKAESDFNPLAVSPKGAVGLMQLMPGTAQDMGVSDRTDPVANIHGGVRYLRELLGQFDNNLILSLAAYNAGPGSVKKYGNTVPPFEETQQYVARVLHYYRTYRGIM